MSDVDQPKGQPVWPPYYANPSTLAAHEAAQKTADWIADEEVEVESGLSDREWMALRSFRVCHEHHHSILALFADGHAASAVALIRPCFESLARGLWCRDLPNDQAIEHFRVGHDTKVPEKLLRECRTPENADIIDRLELLWELSKKDLHGYTHGGFALLVVRDDADAMPTELVERALRFTTQTALAAMMEMLRMVGLYEQSLPELMRHFRQLGRPDEDALALLTEHGL
jgi:hypothetical protein